MTNVTIRTSTKIATVDGVQLTSRAAQNISSSDFWYSWGLR